jgi:hypothetical protein
MKRYIVPVTLALLSIASTCFVVVGLLSLLTAYYGVAALEFFTALVALIPVILLIRERHIGQDNQTQPLEQEEDAR